MSTPSDRVNDSTVFKFAPAGIAMGMADRQGCVVLGDW
jgi:hypothetical protein